MRRYIGGKDPEGRRAATKPNKTVVFAMLDRESGEVISQVVPDAKAGRSSPIIAPHVTKGSTDPHRRMVGLQAARQDGYTTAP